MKHRLLPLLFLSVIAVFQACKKDDDDSPKEMETKGVYVLYEGSWGGNNSGIAFYDYKTGQADPDYFKTVNGYDLGETAVDLEQYGSKIYCVVSGTQGAKNSYLEVMDAATGKSIRRIAFFDDTSEYMPRAVAFYGDKAYVCGLDGNVRPVDTASLSVGAPISAGRYLEGIAVANGKLYVTNQDYTYTGDETTVSIVNIATSEKIGELEVGPNPTRIIANDNGDVFVVLAGSPAGPAAFKKINTKTEGIEASYDYSVGAFAIAGSKGYMVTDPYGSPAIKTFDTSNGVASNLFITDGTSVTIPYGIGINSLNGDVFIGDTQDYSSPTGKAYLFSSDGKIKTQFTTPANNPNHAVFVYGYK